LKRLRSLTLTALGCFVMAAADTPAPPGIAPGGIVNSGSRMPATLRGGAIARGARFLIPGVRLGPEAGVAGDEAKPPVKLADVSVHIRSVEGAADAGLLFVSATRIDAWMPPDAPLGDVQLTVTYQGRTSEPYSLTLVRSSAGFFSSETAPAALAGARGKADGVPGGVVTLWGTGFEEAAPGVFVGGRAAEAVHATPASCCKGVEQIEFRVPADAPLGCYVPVQALTLDGRPTNAVPVAIHPAGQACRDEVDWFRESVENAARAGFLVLARISMDVHFTPRAGSHFDFDYAVGSFGRQESGQRVFPPLPPPRTCTVFTSRINLRQLTGQSRSPEEWTSIPQKTPGNQRLDAGEALTVAGPAGAQRVNRDTRQHDYYAAFLGGMPPFSHQQPKPLYLRPGAYTVSAPGGADLGPFTAKVDVSRAIEWKNRAKIAEVAREAGVTVEWKAANNDDAVLVMAANADRFSGDSAVCLCMAAARDGQFHIPAMALGNLPPTLDDDDLSGSYLLLTEIPVHPPARIEAHGLDSAFAAFVSASARLVKYK
jgi:uncharacterized protein (TIGR03437 family)